MLCHIFHLPFYCVSMLVAYFTHSRTSTCCFDCLVLPSFGQVDGQECLRTFSSYLCFSRLKLYSCYITKFDQVRFEPLCVRSTRSPWFLIDLNFQNLFVHFAQTEISISVKPSSLSWSRFSSRCNRFEPFGPTELQQLYTVLHLGATELFHSVTPTGSGYI